MSLDCTNQNGKRHGKLVAIFLREGEHNLPNLGTSRTNMFDALSRGTGDRRERTHALILFRDHGETDFQYTL